MMILILMMMIIIIDDPDCDVIIYPGSHTGVRLEDDWSTSGEDIGSDDYGDDYGDGDGDGDGYLTAMVFIDPVTTISTEMKILKGLIV